MAGLNYTYTCETFTVVPGETWQQSDLDGDGVSEGGLRPFKIVLTPNPGYTVAQADFSIGGQTEDFGGPQSNTSGWGVPGGVEGWDVNNEEINNTPASRGWDSDDSTLPDSVAEIKVLDAQSPHTQGNTVVFLVYLKPTHIHLYENQEITLDIDGDAQEITADLNVGESNEIQTVDSQSFYLTLRTQDPSIPANIPHPEPNFFVVPNVNDHQNYLENFYNAKIYNNPPWEQNGDISNGQAGSIEFSKHYTPSGEPLTYDSSSIQPESNLSILFYLIPKPGYNLSRHMLRPLMYGSTDLNLNYEWEGNNYYASNNFNIHPSVTTNNVITPNQGLISNGISTQDILNVMINHGMPQEQIDAVALGWPSGVAGFGKDAIGNMLDGNHPYYYNTYDTCSLLIVQNNNATGGFDGQFDNAIPPTNSNNFNLGIQGDIILIDTRYDLSWTTGSNIWPQYEPGYNFTWQTTTSFGSSNPYLYGDTPTIPNGYCPQDYGKNAVAVCINNFNQYIPDSNLLNNTGSGLKFRIYGAASPDDAGCESVGYNIEIGEG